MAGETRITTDLDFEKDGKQVGFLRLPHSVHELAYGWMPIPVVCIRNGSGPQVLLLAGNHGDEYEGQVALTRLARELRPADISGRIIMLPAANLPAALAGRRTSPNEPGEAGNLNRSFPGDPHGSPTSMIAHYIDSVLLAKSDFVFDLHSGGTSLIYVPSAEIKRAKDPRKTAAMIDLVKVFGAPVSCVGITDIAHNLAVAARNRELIHMGTELGGGGTVSGDALKLAEDGLRRVLRHVGSLAPDYAVAEAPPTRLMEVGGLEYYVYSPEQGVFEPYVELGATVEDGQPAGAIHFPESPERQSIEVHFLQSGFVVCRRTLARTRRGDCLYHLATDLADA